jgi:hypothetical protein
MPCGLMQTVFIDPIRKLSFSRRLDLDLVAQKLFGKAKAIYKDFYPRYSRAIYTVICL